MYGELVHVETRDGVRLDGILGKPATGAPSNLGLDAIVLHHGVTDTFYGPGIYDDFQEPLLQKGCAVLRVNNRGHDPVSLSTTSRERRRLGAAYESLDDCRLDWQAWLDFAQAQGYQKLGLWGHSLGAVKSIYYMAVQHDQRVQCVVAASPPRFNHSHYLSIETDGDFQRAYQEADLHMKKGEPEDLIETAYPTPLLITAKTFVDKYGPDDRYDILKHIPAVQVPLLVTIGGGEAEDMLAFKGLPAQVEQLAGELNLVSFEGIPEADHFYTHQRGYVWNVVSS